MMLFINTFIWVTMQLLSIEGGCLASILLFQNCLLCIPILANHTQDLTVLCLKKELLQQFELDTICVGISFLEVSLVHNIFSFAQKPLFVPDAHLTFHIGMDVLVNRSNDFYRHNKSVFFNAIHPKIKPYFSLKKFPYGSLGFFNRMLKWGLNPSLFFRNYLSLEVKSIKAKLDEIRWRILQK